MKSEKQYKDSATIAGWAMLGGILTLVGMVIYNMIVYGVS